MKCECVKGIFQWWNTRVSTNQGLFSLFTGVNPISIACCVQKLWIFKEFAEERWIMGNLWCHTGTVFEYLMYFFIILTHVNEKYRHFLSSNLCFHNFLAQSKMNVIQCFSGIKFWGHIDHFNYKEQQKILEAICRCIITICNLEGTLKSVFDKDNLFLNKNILSYGQAMGVEFEGYVMKNYSL